MTGDNLYRDFILEHYREPHNRGVLEPHDLHFADSNPTCGDEMSMTLRLDEARERVADVAFDGRGCAISQASASMLCEKIEGKSIDEAKDFSAKDMLELFGARLTPNRQKCCLLSWRVLQQAMHSRLTGVDGSAQHDAPEEKQSQN